MREHLDRYLLRGLFADTTVEADPGTGGATFAVDDAGAGGVFPYAKQAFGASGTQTPVSSANPLPVTGTLVATGTLAATQSGAWNIGTLTAVTGTVTVAGTVATTNAGTFAVQNNGTGKSLKTASGTLTSDTDVIAAVSSKRLKVYAMNIFTVGTNANAAIFKSNGTGGTELWRFLIQAVSGSPMGLAMGVSPPSFLFATAAGEKLTLDVGNADTIHYSLAYWDDDAT